VIPKLIGVAENIKEVRAKKRFTAGDAKKKAVKVKILFYFIQNAPVFGKRQFFAGMGHAVAAAVKTVFVALQRELQKELPELGFAV
jgi:hypothetical protein